MAEIINLRTARKNKARADKAMAAEQNRAKFGRSKAEKRMLDAEKSRAVRQIDGHKRDD